MLDQLGLLVVGALIFLGIGLIAHSRLPLRIKRILISALLLRIVSTLYYYHIVFGPGGRGDARMYYYYGLFYAGRFSEFDFSPFWDTTIWYSPNRWWGTQFVTFPTGLVITLFGSSIMATMLVFSLLGFIGLLCFARVFHRAYPHVEVSRFLAALLFLPSGAFWTSAIGKEAIITFGLGLAALGLLARRGSPNWFLAAAGTFLIYAIRPQVAAVFVMAVVLANVLARQQRWTPFRVLRLVAILGAGLWVLNSAMQEVGAEGADDISGVQGYIEDEAGSAAQGETAVAEKAPGLAGAPMGLFNTLFRPLPWEVGSVTQLMAALEMAFFWGFVFRNRRRLWTSLRAWRSDVTLCFSLIFALTYATALGMVMVNVGIIARQRIYVFPCLLLVVMMEPVRRRIAGRGGMDVPLSPAPPALAGQVRR
jgi:hypothetical protein